MNVNPVRHGGYRATFILSLARRVRQIPTGQSLSRIERDDCQPAHTALRAFSSSGWNRVNDLSHVWDAQGQINHGDSIINRVVPGMNRNNPETVGSDGLQPFFVYYFFLLQRAWIQNSSITS